jgi:quercetin dioxygenase-like cupin family protein
MSKVFRFDTVKADDVETEGALKVKVRWLITKELGAPNFAMRVFEVDSSGQSPLHEHPWEHEVFVLEGLGQLFNGKKATQFKAGDVIFVPPNEMHQFKNSGKALLRFICLIPHPKE